MEKHNQPSITTDPETDALGAGQQALNDALRTSFRVLRWVMLFLLIAYSLSGFYSVREHEVAMTVVFGRVTGHGDRRIKGPGLRLTWPRPIARVIKVPAARVHTVDNTTFWFERSDLPFEAAPPPPATLHPVRDGYALTGDANILHVHCAAHYTINDPERYVFAVVDPHGIVDAELQRAVISTANHFSVDAALRTDLARFRMEIERRLRQRCDDLNLGLVIERVELMGVAPPLQVGEAFASVVQAEQQRSRMIGEARSYMDRTINEAHAEASQMVAEGQADRIRFVKRLSADADYFSQIRAASTDDPATMRRLLLQDTLRRILPHIKEQFIIREPQGEQEFRLKLGPGTTVEREDDIIL